MGDLIDYRLIRLHNQQIKWSSSAKKEQMYINYLIKYLIMLTFNTLTFYKAQELSFNSSKFPSFMILSSFSRAIAFFVYRFKKLQCHGVIFFIIRLPLVCLYFYFFIFHVLFFNTWYQPWTSKQVEEKKNQPSSRWCPLDIKKSLIFLEIIYATHVQPKIW